MAFVYSFFFCETATVPSLNPLRKRLRTTLRWDMRPVPVIFLRMAFSDQLQLRMRAPGNPHEAHVFFWMWKDDFPHRRHKVCVLLRRLPNELVPLVILICLEVYYVNYVNFFVKRFLVGKCSKSNYFILSAPRSANAKSTTS